jgi:hypothetical protein
VVGFSISCRTGNEDRTGHSRLDSLLYSIELRARERNRLNLRPSERSGYVFVKQI